MPSESKKQHRFMEAVKHSPKFARAAGVPQSVGEHFVAADKSAGQFNTGGHVMGKTMQTGHHFGRDGGVRSTLKYAKGGTVHHQSSRKAGAPTRSAAGARALDALAAGAMAGPPPGAVAGPPLTAPPPRRPPPQMAAPGGAGQFKRGGSTSSEFESKSSPTKHGTVFKRGGLRR